MEHLDQVSCRDTLQVDDAILELGKEELTIRTEQSTSNASYLVFLWIC